MATYKYICNVCNLTFDDADTAANHITVVKHKKKNRSSGFK